MSNNSRLTTKYDNNTFHLKTIGIGNRYDKRMAVAHTDTRCGTMRLIFAIKIGKQKSS